MAPRQTEALGLVAEYRDIDVVTGDDIKIAEYEVFLKECVLKDPRHTSEQRGTHTAELAGLQDKVCTKQRLLTERGTLEEKLHLP
ncbi:hypothetical protein KIPB_001406 [Kipferlia bialata]|uniref:Uncharacterized protein n=1 Tax=Kipferlia bialata TaxID=797122 RepID=A0A9K3CNV9_9EUKA|nr:hypothetical protein KIPB_001406 [Kipferlia bialata]|eukprot:g1406.t1